jgi:hypothetical protein
MGGGKGGSGHGGPMGGGKGGAMGAPTLTLPVTPTA